MTTDPSSPSSPSGASASSGPAAPPDPPPFRPGPSVPPVPPPPSDPGESGPGSDADADRLAAASPATPAAELARIAASRPDLHPALAANPATYPDLVDWLRTSPDPAVQTALARRAAAPAQPTPVKTEASAETTANVAANPSPAGAPPTARTRRRTGLPRRPAVIAVAVLVTVLVISGAAWAGIHLLGPGSRAGSSSAAGSSENASEAPSDDPTPDALVPAATWADGAHEAWTLDAGEKERTSITVVDDQLFVTTYTPESTPASVIAYSIAGAEPERQWETRIRDMEGYQRGVWGDYLIIGGELIRRSDGQNTYAPWSDPDLLVVINDTAIACRKPNACEAWRASDPASRVWSAVAEGWQTLLGIDGMRFDSRTNVYVGERTIIALSAKTLVDVDTGETFDLSPDDYGSVIATTDGWIAFNGKNSNGKEEYTILSPTGEKKGTFRSGSEQNSDEWFAATPSQERPSSEQYRRLIEKGDLSWAEVSVDYTGLGKDGCGVSINFGGTTIEDDLGPTGVNCILYPSVYSPSAGGEVILALSDSPFSPESARVMGAWTLADQREITFPGSNVDKSIFYLAGPSLMIALDYQSGRITAYAPGRG